MLLRYDCIGLLKMFDIVLTISLIRRPWMRKEMDI